jgi:hypothetical protein
MEPIRLWSAKIESIFTTFFNHKKYLLCVTGDIDNLGIFVAQNGRAEAENFVEIVNHAIGYFLSSVLHFKDQDYIYIPSGEEVIIMFVGDESDLAETRRVFPKENTRTIHSFLKEFLARYSYPEYLSVSFGVTLFAFDDVQKDIGAFLKGGTVEEKNHLYLDCMRKIRALLGRELDKQKFQDILSFNHSVNEVFLRNLVYKEMLAYKKTTKEKILQEKFKLEPERIEEAYGVTSLPDIL